MTDTWLKQYMAEKLWLSDPLLVREDGTKLCASCEELHYTVNFPDCDLFQDTKLPVCTVCFKSRKLVQKVRNILDRYGYNQACKKCKENKPLHEYSYSKPINGIYHTCKKCMTEEIKKRLGN